MTSDLRISNVHSAFGVCLVWLIFYEWKIIKLTELKTPANDYYGRKPTINQSEKNNVCFRKNVSFLSIGPSDCGHSEFNKCTIKKTAELCVFWGKKYIQWQHLIWSVHCLQWKLWIFFEYWIFLLRFRLK